MKFRIGVPTLTNAVARRGDVRPAQCRSRSRCVNSSRVGQAGGRPA